LLIKLLEKMRETSIRIIAKSYKPTKVPVDFIQSELAFDSLSECLEFLEKESIILSDDNSMIDTKNC